MSYSSDYSTSVHYSGSKTVHYPASQNGGSITVSYSGDIPVNVSIYVDTDSFEQSVAQTKQSLTLVAGALSATEAAQVAQIQKSANDISNTVIRDFFQLISSEMSSEASEFSSAMSSCTGLLVEEGQRVDAIHGQMEEDYNNIKSRYLRLFDGLDRELDRRIRELDRPAFELSSKISRVVGSPYEESAAAALTHTEQAHMTPLKLMLARAKNRTSEALSTLGSVCGYLNDYQEVVQDVMDDEPEAAFVFIPVVYTMEQDLDSGNLKVSVHDEALGDTDVKRRIINYVGTAPEQTWQAPTQEDQTAIDQAFMQCLSDYGTAQPADDEQRERVCQKIMQMYQEAHATTSYRS